MKLPFKINLKFPKTPDKVASILWTGASVFLAALFLGALLFDGSVFLNKVQTIGREYIAVTETQEVKNIDRANLDAVLDIFAARAERLKTAREHLPKKNPFK